MKEFSKEERKILYKKHKRKSIKPIWIKIKEDIEGKQFEQET